MSAKTATEEQTSSALLPLRPGPENVPTDFEALLCTFSFAFRPQILKVDGHGLACDLWSIGVMAYALVSGEFPWYSESRDVCGQMIKYTPLKFPEEASGAKRNEKARAVP